MGRRVVVLVVADPLGRVHRVRRPRRVSLAGLVCREGRWLLVAAGDSYVRLRWRVLGQGDNWKVLPLRVEQDGGE